MSYSTGVLAVGDGSALSGTDLGRTASLRTIASWLAGARSVSVVWRVSLSAVADRELRWEIGAFWWVRLAWSELGTYEYTSSELELEL